MPLARTRGSSFSPDTRPPAAHHPLSAAAPTPLRVHGGVHRPLAPRRRQARTRRRPGTAARQHCLSAVDQLVPWHRRQDEEPRKPIAAARYTEDRSTRLTSALCARACQAARTSATPRSRPGRQAAGTVPGCAYRPPPLSRVPGWLGIWSREAASPAVGDTNGAVLRPRGFALRCAAPGMGQVGAVSLPGAVIEGALCGSRDGEHHEEPAVGAHAARDGRARLRQRAGAPGRGFAEEITHGWFNVAYRIRLRDGRQVVLKIAPPSDVAVLTARGMMRTELAAMALVRERTTSGAAGRPRRSDRGTGRGRLLLHGVRGRGQLRHPVEEGGCRPRWSSRGGSSWARSTGTETRSLARTSDRWWARARRHGAGVHPADGGHPRRRRRAGVDIGRDYDEIRAVLAENASALDEWASRGSSRSTCGRRTR